MRPLLAGTANIIGVVLFLGIFSAFLLQVVARYIFNWPLGWPDEAIKILFVWVVFWGSAFMVPLDKQISFDLLKKTLPRRISKISSIAAMGICCILFLTSVPITAEFIVFSNGLDTPILEVPLGYIYLPFLFFIVASVIRMAIKIRSDLKELKTNEGASL